jgi:hypothetical protein
MKDNEIKLCSDIFYRLDVDRKIQDELKKLHRHYQKTGEDIPIQEFLRKKK